MAQGHLVFERDLEEESVITVPPSNEPRTISIMVTRVRGDRVRLGFKADKDVRIHRREVYEAILRDGERK